MDAVTASALNSLGAVLLLESTDTAVRHSVSGLSGALRLTLEFLNSNAQNDLEVGAQTLQQLESTLDAISKKLRHHSRLRARRVCGLRVGAFWMYSAAYVGLGNARLVSQLQRLEADLAGDLAFLDLQIKGSQAQALSLMSGQSVLRDFSSRSVRDFWTARFGSSPFADADVLALHLRAQAGALSARMPHAPVGVVCRHAVGRLRHRGGAPSVSARDFAFATRDSASVGDWLLAFALSRAGSTCLAPAHSSRVAAVAAGDALFVTGSADGTVKLFDLGGCSRGLLLRATLAGHSGGVTAVACGAVGGREAVASGSDSGEACTWDVALGARVARVSVDAAVVSVALSGDVLVAVTRSLAHAVCTFNAATGAPLARARGHVGGTIAAVAAPSRDLLVSTGLDRAVRFWSCSTAKASEPAVEQAHRRGATALAVSSDGARAAFFSAPTVFVWTAGSSCGQFPVSPSSSATVTGLCFGGCPDTLLAVVADAVEVTAPPGGERGEPAYVNPRVQAHDARTGALLGALELDGRGDPSGDPSAYGTCAAFGRDGRLVVGFSDGGVVLVDARAPRTMRELSRVAPTAAAPCRGGADLLLPARHNAAARARYAPLALAGPAGTLLAAVGARDVVLTAGAHTARFALPSAVRSACAFGQDWLVATDSASHVFRASSTEPAPGPPALAGAEFLAAHGETVFALRGGRVTRHAAGREDILSEHAVGANIVVCPRHAHGLRCADGPLLAYGVAGHIGLYDIERGHHLPPLPHAHADPDPVTRLAACESGSALLSVHGHQDVVQWARRGSALASRPLEAHPLSDGDASAAAGAARDAFAAFACTSKFAAPYMIADVGVGHGVFAYSMLDGSVTVRDAATHEPLRTATVHSFGPASVALAGAGAGGAPGARAAAVVSLVSLGPEMRVASWELGCVPAGSEDTKVSPTPGKPTR